jgi:chromosome segregation ATPase
MLPAMGKADKQAPEIVRAAAALEDELADLEAVSRSVRKIRLSSDKNIARAAAELGQTLSMPERLGERLQALAAAMATLQERQQAALEPLAAFAAEIKRRTELLGEHMRRFEALGKTAAELNDELTAGAKDRAALARVEARLQEISDAARSLFESARDADFPEVAREADVLKQRMAALRKRLAESA